MRQRPHNNGSIPVEGVDGITKRGGMTLVSFVCNLPEMQQHMPHIFVCAAQLMCKSAFEETHQMLPRNMYLLRRKSGWVNSNTMKDIFTLFDALVK